jgi:hypothetical protein
MAVEVKHSGKSMEQRIADRLKNSGDPRADHHALHGTGPTRTHTNIHNAGHVVQPGTAARETGPQEQRHHDSATTQGTGYSRSASPNNSGDE